MDNSIREYMQYFATQEHGSAKMKCIHDLVEQYRKAPFTKKAYMTLEQELNIRYKKVRKEGLAEGRNEEKRELAKALRNQGKLTLAGIASVSGLTPEEIKAFLYSARADSTW